MALRPACLQSGSLEVPGRGDSQSSTLSCVSAPHPGKSEATAGQAPGTGLEKAESQPEEGQAAGGDFQPHSAETEHLLCPSTPPPDSSLQATVLGPLLQPPELPRLSGHSQPEGCSISWSAASSATATSATISSVQIESQLSISPKSRLQSSSGPTS